MMMVARRPRETFADGPVGLLGLDRGSDSDPVEIPPRPASESPLPWHFDLPPPIVVSSPRSSRNDLMDDDEIILPDLNHVITPLQDTQPRLVGAFDRGSDLEQTMRKGRGELTGLLIEVRMAEAQQDYKRAEAEWNAKIQSVKAEARKKIEALVERQRHEVHAFDAANGVPIVAKTQFVELTNATSSSVFKGKAIGTQRKVTLARVVASQRQEMINRHKREIVMLTGPSEREVRALEKRKADDLARKQAIIDEISAEMGKPVMSPKLEKVPKTSCRMKAAKVPFFGLSSERSKLLLELYAAARRTETVREATERLTEMWKEPGTVFDHLVLLNECPDSVTRDFVCLSLRKLVGAHFGTFSMEQVVSVRDALLRFVESEKETLVRYHMCDVVVKLLFNVENEEMWTPLYELATTMVKSQQMLSTGLYIWRNCYAGFPLSGSHDMWVSLLAVTVSAIGSASEEDRTQAIALIQTLLDAAPNELSSDAQMGVIDNVLGAIAGELKGSIVNNSEQELQSVVNLVCSLFEDPPLFLGYEKLMPFVEIATAILSDASVPMDVRCIVHMIISSAASLVAEEFGDRLVELVRLSIGLSCELCSAQRDDSRYEFAFHFFYVVASSFDDNVTSILEFFLKCIVALVQGKGMVERQVAMFVLKAIVEGTQEVMSDQLGEVLKLIFQASDGADEYVISASCKTIEEIIDFMSSSISFFIDDVTAFLFRNIANPDAMHTLDLLFYKCDRAPQNLEEIIKLLVSLIPKSRVEQIEQIIECVASSLSRIETPNEAIFGTLTPILNQILQERPSLRGSVLEFFGRIAKVSPESVRVEISKIVEFGTMCLTSEAYDCWLAATAFGLIAQVLPVTLAPYVSQIVPNLIVVLQMKEDDMVESQVNMLRKSQNAAIVSLGTFVGYLPEHMKEYAQSPILEYIMNKRDSLVSVCEAIGYGAEGFSHLGISLDEFITTNLLTIHTIQTKDSICALLMAFSEIIFVYGDKLSSDVIAERLRYILSVPSDYFLRTDHSQTIDQQIQVCLFHCIGQFIDALGEGFGRYADAFIGILHKHFSNISSLMRGHVIMTAAHICYACKITSEIFQMTLNNALREIMGSTSMEGKRLCAKGLKWLVMANKDALANRLELIGPFSVEIMADCEYYALWITLAMYYNHLSNAEVLQAAIALMPPPADSEDVVLCADFAVFVAKACPDAVAGVLPQIAISLFSSNPRHVQQAKEETRAGLSGILKGISESELVVLCKNNEHAFTRVRENLALM